jgi:hypothetical protein
MKHPPCSCPVFKKLKKQGQFIAYCAIAAYVHRDQYGGLFVAGSAAIVGGIVAMRMGKIPGALAADMASAAAYGNIYGYEDYSATLWRKSVPRKE